MQLNFYCIFITFPFRSYSSLDAPNSVTSKSSAFGGALMDDKSGRCNRPDVNASSKPVLNRAPSFTEEGVDFSAVVAESGGPLTAMEKTIVVNNVKEDCNICKHNIHPFHLCAANKDIANKIESEHQAMQKAKVSVISVVSHLLYSHFTCNIYLLLGSTRRSLDCHDKCIWSDFWYDSSR